MSKQKTAKEIQKYEPKPVFAMCSNCYHFKSEFETGQFGYVTEKNIRCGLGGFAVKKQGTCNNHSKAVQ